MKEEVTAVLAPARAKNSEIVGCAQRLHSSFLGLPYRILYMNPKKELLWSLCVGSLGPTPLMHESLEPKGYQTSVGAISDSRLRRQCQTDSLLTLRA